MTRSVSDRTRGEIEFIKEYLVKQYTIGNTPPDNILEWQQRWFKGKIYPEVYHLVHTASIEVAEESKGGIWFWHNIFEDKWRFHKGENDYLTMHYGTEKRIGGHMSRQDWIWKKTIELAPAIQKEIVFIETPILNVTDKKVLQLKQKSESL